MLARLRSILFGVVGLFVITFPFVWTRLVYTEQGDVQLRWNLADARYFFGGLGPIIGVGLGFVALFWLGARFNLADKSDPFWRRANRAVFSHWWTVALLVIAAMSPALFLNEKALNLAVLVGIYMILATGLNITVGLAGLLVLGYAGFYAFGAYSFAVAQNYIPGLPWWAATPFVFVLGAGLGWLLGLPCLRLRGDYLAIVTLGFAEGFRSLIKNLSLTNGDMGIQIKTSSQMGLLSDPLAPGRSYIIIILFVAGTVFVVYRIYHSPIGRSWVAIREDETAAAAMGVPVVRMKLLAFALSSAFGAVGGLLYAAYAGYVSPSICSFENSALVLAMVILGGLGSLPGVLAGAAILYLLPEMLRSYTSYDFRLLIFGLMMVCMMLFRPQGLFGSRRHELEMHPSK